MQRHIVILHQKHAVKVKSKAESKRGRQKKYYLMWEGAHGKESQTQVWISETLFLYLAVTPQSGNDPKWKIAKKAAQRQCSKKKPTTFYGTSMRLHSMNQGVRCGQPILNKARVISFFFFVSTLRNKCCSPPNYHTGWQSMSKSSRGIEDSWPRSVNSNIPNFWPTWQRSRFPLKEWQLVKTRLAFRSRFFSFFFFFKWWTLRRKLVGVGCIPCCSCEGQSKLGRTLRLLTFGSGPFCDP